jgi:hypothetical protein
LWYRCCFYDTMRNFFKDTDSSSDARQEDVLPAPPAHLPFLWTRTSKLKEVWDIVRATRLWPNVVITADRTGLCFAVTGFSLAHLNWDGRLDLPFRSTVLNEVVGAEADDRDSDRTVFQIQTESDVDSALRLLRLAYLIADSNSPRMCS